MMHKNDKKLLSIHKTNMMMMIYKGKEKKPACLDIQIKATQHCKQINNNVHFFFQENLNSLPEAFAKL